MKICPVCNARCYDDMSLCYGCLHDFSKDEYVKKMPSAAIASPDQSGVPFEFGDLAVNGIGIEDVEEAVNPGNASTGRVTLVPGISFDVPQGFRMVVSMEPV